MNAHSDFIRSVAFSPNGTKIVSGSDDKTIKVWDFGAPRAQNRASLAKTDAIWLAVADKLELLSEKTNAHSDWIKSVAFSPDGTKIVSGSDDKTVKVWDSGAQNPHKIAPPWPKLTPAGLSGRQTGAAERENQRPQKLRPVGGVFP